MKKGYVIFDSNGAIKDRKSLKLVATSSGVDTLYVFADFDVSTTETAYRATVRIEKANGVITGPHLLTLSQITEEEKEEFGVDYLACRKLEFKDKMLNVPGRLVLTIVYDQVDVNGKVLRTAAQGRLDEYVYEAVPEVPGEEEINEIRAEFMPRDLGDLTNAEVLDGNERLVAKQSNFTKGITPSQIKEYVSKDVNNPINPKDVANKDYIDKVIKDLGWITSTDYDNITELGLYRFKITGATSDLKGSLLGTMLVRERKIDDFSFVLEQVRSFGDLVQKRERVGSGWSAWNTIDLFEIKQLIDEGVVRGLLATEIETKLLEKEQEFTPRLTSVELNVKNKADRSYVDMIINAAANGTPKIIRNTFAGLPTLGGNEKLALVLENGHLYFDNGLQWADIGPYQTIALSSFELARQKLNNDILGTKQKVIYDINGNVNKLQHIDSNLKVVREDVFSYTSNIITEVRTLSTGEVLTFIYNLETLETEVI